MTTNIGESEISRIETVMNENSVKRMLYGEDGINYRVIAMDYEVVVTLIKDAGLVRSFTAHKIESGPDQGKWFGATLDTKTGEYRSYDLTKQYRDRVFAFGTNAQFLVPFVKAHRSAKQALRACKDFNTFNDGKI